MSRPGTGHQADPTALDPATSISKSAYAVAKSLDAAINPPSSADDNTHAPPPASSKTLGNTSSSSGGSGSGGGSGGATDEEKEKRRVRVAEENLRQKELESEVMGTVKKGVTSQSDIKERNLSQMISVLHMRLANLEKRQKERFVRSLYSCVVRLRTVNNEPTVRHVLCAVFSIYVKVYSAI
jgi:hypothetical protein